MSTDQDRQQADQTKHHEHARERERVAGAESPRELLAVDDPSKHNTRGRQTAGPGHGVTVQWVRPTDLAARVAARGAAGAVAAHVAAHRQVRDRVRERLAGDGNGRRGRLAPVSAFGRQGRAEQAVADRSVVGR